MAKQSEIRVRRGTRADTEGAWHVFQTHINWVNVWHDNSKVIQRRIDKEFVDYLFRTYPSAVAEHDGVIVGFAVTENREVGVLEIMNMYIDDSFRGQGIGTEMLQLIEEQCHPRGMSMIMAFSSDMYFPGKKFPTGVFERCGYEAKKIGLYTEMYTRSVPLTDEEARRIHPVRRVSYTTIEDIEIERAGSNDRMVTITLADEEPTTDLRTDVSTK